MESPSWQELGAPGCDQCANTGCGFCHYTHAMAQMHRNLDDAAAADDDDDASEASAADDVDDASDYESHDVSPPAATTAALVTPSRDVAVDKESDVDYSDYDDVYRVEKLLKFRETRSGSFEFFVRWKNYAADHDSWEPASNLRSLKPYEDDIEELMGPDGRDIVEESVSKKRASRKKSPAATNKRVRSASSTPARSGKRNSASRQISAQGITPAQRTKLIVSPKDGSPEPLFVNSALNVSLARAMFGDRLRKITTKDSLDRVWNRDGSAMELLGTKDTPRNNSGGKARFMGSSSNNIDAYYVVTGGPRFPNMNLSQELEKFADFSAIHAPNKAAARIELLFTDAHKFSTNKYRLLDDLSPDVFEVIPELYHVGCGFIPRKLMTQFLGNRGTRAGNTSSLQVRILIPSMGLFKGMLTIREGIDRIQLPASMLKAPRSRYQDRKDEAYLLIKATFPSEKCGFMTKVLQKATICKSDKEYYENKKVSEMLKLVMQQAGVDEGLIEAYEGEYNQDIYKRRHWFVVGVCDPTDALLAGHVYITGLRGVDHVIVSRTPCTAARDQLTLPVITRKPPGMTKQDWASLEKRPFGEIIFGPPHRGQATIPETVVDGDLDGDLYFVCWHKPFVDNINQYKIHKPFVLDDAKFADPNPDWHAAAQHFMLDNERQKAYGAIMGELHGKWKSLVFSEPENAEYFGEAFKKSLEIKKHGGKIYLPRHLWNRMRKNVQCLLTDAKHHGR